MSIGAWKAERAAKLTVAENPSGTSIDCSGCGERVPKTLADRQHICPSCNLVLCRDLNAAINLKQRVVGRQTLNLTGNVSELSGSHCRSPRCLLLDNESREYVTNQKHFGKFFADCY